MGVGERQRAVRLYRGQIPSPGRPTVAWRQDRVRFWAAIARGIKTEDAAVEAGVSSPVAFRWFRNAGGVNPRLIPTVSGRYLSPAERENIALWGRAPAWSRLGTPPGGTIGTGTVSDAPLSAGVAAVTTTDGQQWSAVFDTLPPPG